MADQLVFFNVEPEIEEALETLNIYEPPSSMGTIIVEEKLASIFDYLPSMRYSNGLELFKPVFRYGDQKELNVFLKSYESEQSSPYPLIWLLYPNKEIHHKKKVELPDLTLILAVNTNDKMLNNERIATTYKKLLIPLYENVFRALQKATNVNLVEKVDMIKFPNFGDKDYDSEESFTTDLWDALKTTWKIEITNACLKDIKI